jgi:hypothetical protein
MYDMDYKRQLLCGYIKFSLYDYIEASSVTYKHSLNLIANRQKKDKSRKNHVCNPYHTWFIQ